MLGVATYLLVVGACLSCLGHLSRDIERAIAVVGFIVWVGAFALPGAVSHAARSLQATRSTRIAALALGAIAVPAAWLSPDGLIWFVACGFAAVALWLQARAPRVAAECASAALAVVAVGIGAELLRIFPAAWHLQMAAADAYCRVAAWIAREPRNLGPTAMALPLLGAALALVAARSVLGSGATGRAAWRIALLLCIAQLVYLVALTPLASWFAKHRPAWQSLLLNSQWFAILVLSIAFALGDAWASRRRGDRPLSAVTARPVAWRRLVRDPRLAGALVLGLVVGYVAGRAPQAPVAKARVLLYDAGYTNWKVPQHGEYGERSGGMFGLLPFLLQAAGHEVVVSKDLSQLEGPNAPNVVALINIQEFLEVGDKERLLAFVRRGGGLLCMGDHTGVAGIRGPFNNLLEPAGIRFVFDSATFFHEGWSTGAELRRHAMNRGVRDGENYQIWVGASLDIDANVRPVVVGRYGYSDMGDMSNLRMSFLGDRRYNPDEQLGDIVLVAESRLGNGKVLVFGDTSTYQNLALPRSWDVVLRSFDHLARRGGGGLGASAQWWWLLAFVAGLGAVTAGGRRALPVAAAALGLWVASVAATVGGTPEHTLDWSRVRAPSLAAAVGGTVPKGTAVVDRSHGGRYDLRAWFDPSIGGLLLNLIRDGFFPIVADEFPAHALERADVFVTIAPMRAYDGGERAALRRFLERGGRAIVAVGWEDYDGARSFLADHEFAVLDVPLSHFRTGERPEDLVFRNAWALRPPADGRVLVSQWGHPVVASRRVGRGELIVIGDTTWYWNRNLEGREQWFVGNIGFASALARGLPITPVAGRYRDPRDAVAEAAAAAQPQPQFTPQQQQPQQQTPHMHGPPQAQQQAPHVHGPQQPQQQAPHVHGQQPAQQQTPHVHGQQQPPHQHPPQPPQGNRP